MAGSPGEFALQVRTLREAQGLSLRALAGLVGVSSVTIWKWENGDSKPRARLIAPLARALDISPKWLQASIKGVPDQAGSADSDQVDLTVMGQFDAAAVGEREADGQPEALADVIARAKQMIADASGTASSNVTIRIEY